MIIHADKTPLNRNKVTSACGQKEGEGHSFFDYRVFKEMKTTDYYDTKCQKCLDKVAKMRKTK